MSRLCRWLVKILAALALAAIATVRAQPYAEPLGSVSPVFKMAGDTSPFTLTRDADPQSMVYSTYNWVNKPGGGYDGEGWFPLGTYYYYPTAGVGTYVWYYYAVDPTYSYWGQTITFYVCDVNPITVTTSGGGTYDARTTNPQIYFGQTATVNATVIDPSGTMDSTGINGDKGITGNWVQYGTWDSFSASSSHSYSLAYQPTAVGTGYHWMAVFGHNAYGYPGRGFSLVVNKTTPTASFASHSYAPSSSTGVYTLTSGDLSATFTNPYSTSVAAPTGTVTYSIVGPGTAVTVGSTLGSGSTYTIRASYPGDANYNATSVDASFTISGPTVPTSVAAPTIGSTFVTLSWAAATSPAGIASYRVYRNGTLIASSITTLGYTDSTAAASTSYSYTVQAVDNNGNVSASSSAATPTTLRPLQLFTPTP